MAMPTTTIPTWAGHCSTICIWLREVANRTIVLTGALAPARFSETDAPFNLGMAFATAQTAPAGVYITVNGCVFRGDEVIKDRERGCFVLRED